MKLVAYSLFLATLLHSSVATIPDVVTSDLDTISNDAASFNSASGSLPVTGYVEKSLVLAWDGSTIPLSNDIHNGFLNALARPLCYPDLLALFNVNKTELSAEDSAALVTYLGPFKDRTIDALSKLKTKDTFRASYSPVALADLTKLRDRTSDYIKSLTFLTPYPSSLDVIAIGDSIAAAYAATIAYYNYQS